MSDKKNYLDHHPKPVTRRQFLASGLTTFSATMLLPNAFSLFGNSNAWAGECDAPASGEMIPCLIFDMVGGAGLPGNFLVTNQAGDLLKSYSLLGWNPLMAGAIDKSYGLPMSVQASQLRNGLNGAASAEARANLRMGSFCHFGQDDQSTNPLNMLHYLLRFGCRGKAFRNGLGTMNSLSGGNSIAAELDTSFKPLYVSSVNDVIETVAIGKVFQDVSKEKMAILAQGMWSANFEQVKSLLGISGQRLAKAARCAYEDNLKGSDGLQIDPRTDPIFQEIYGLQPQTQPNSRPAIAAAVVKNVLTGLSGPGVIALGDCDYHTGDNIKGDQRDAEMGQLIGRAVQAAHRLGKPLFFQLITDGGVSADPSTRNWRSDSGEKSMTVVGFYSPKGPATMRKFQIGHYTDGQGADLTSFIGNNQVRVAASCFANYLQVSNKLEGVIFSNYVSNGVLSAPDVSNVLLFS